MLSSFQLSAYKSINIGPFQIVFNPKYHRCVSKDKVESAVVQIIAIIVPLVVIPCMYITMLATICHHKVKCRRFFITSTAIVGTGLIAYLPSALASMFNIPMSYEFSQVATVTIYYSNSIINPLIYFCSHPKAKDAIVASAKGHEVGSRLSVGSRVSTAHSPNLGRTMRQTVCNEVFQENEV